jgi:hypothetical protein
MKYKDILVTPSQELLSNPKKTSLDKVDWLLILALAVGCIIIRLLFFYGFLGTDDSVITSSAIRIIEDGLYVPSSHYDSRFGLILPVAAFFKLFNIGIIQTTIFPFLCSIGLTASTYALCRKSNISKEYAAFGALIPTFMPISVLFGTSIYPEIPFAFFISLSLLLIINFVNKHKQHMNMLVLLGLFITLFIAYMIKIEVVFIIGGYFLFFLYIKQFKLALIILSFPLLFMFLENILFFTESGLLNRVDILTSGKSNMKVNASHSGGQLWVFPKSMFITFYNFGLHFYFLFAAFIWFFINRKSNHQQLILFLTIPCVVFLFWLQFGGTPKSLIRFLTTGVLVTKSHLDRYLIMILPFSSVIIAYFVYNSAWFNKRFLRPLAAFALIASMLVMLPLNDISQEYALSYTAATKYLKQNPPENMYCDRATCSYFNKLKELGELKEYQFINIVNHESKTGITTPNEEFVKNGGFVLINKNRYLYYNSRYTISYPTLESLNQLGEKTVLVSNPGSPISYMYLDMIKKLLQLSRLDNFIVNKMIETINEATDADDVFLIHISAKNVKHLEYLE